MSVSSSSSSGPSWIWSGPVPCLNGFRAIAVSCVIASHLVDFGGAWSLGHFGVTSFFVISGFLITLLLLRERRSHGTISLSAFYARRTLRIIPAYLVLLGITALYARYNGLNISGLTWLSTLTYTSCFTTLSIDPLLAHSWSLSVEEHFYLLWPLVFATRSPRRAVQILLGLMAAFLVFRIVFFQAYISPWNIDYSSFSQMFSIAIGCLVAFVVTGHTAPDFNRFLLAYPGQSAAAALVFGLGSPLLFRLSPSLRTILTDPLRAICFSLVMVGILYLSESSWLQRLLECRPFHFLGLLSYSLYLWQQLATSLYRHSVLNLPACLALLLVLACSSYFLVEKTFLRWKARFSR